jgi:hypothetical protein
LRRLSVIVPIYNMAPTFTTFVVNETGNGRKRQEKRHGRAVTQSPQMPGNAGKSSDISAWRFTVAPMMDWTGCADKRSNNSQIEGRRSGVL